MLDTSGNLERKEGVQCCSEMKGAPLDNDVRTGGAMKDDLDLEYIPPGCI